MQKLVLSFLVLGLLSGLGAAQLWMEPFNYTGTTLGSWAEYLGDWTAVNNMAQSEQKGAYQYLVQPNRVFQDCALECYVEYNTSSVNKLQFGGVTFRCNNPAGNTDLIHVKVQDNDSSGDFDSIWLYDRPGGSTAKTSITPVFLKCTVRMLSIGTRIVAQVDSDMDGKWDHVLTRATTIAVKPGPVGLCAYGGALMDDFEVFDGVLLDDVASPTPQPGAVVKFVMRGKASAAYQAACSFGTRGFVLPDGRIVPLTVDGLFFASIAAFPGFGGLLDANGDGTLQVAIPKAAGLVGLTFYTAFVNYDGTGILNISNDHQVTIVP